MEQITKQKLEDACRTPSGSGCGFGDYTKNFVDFLSRSCRPQIALIEKRGGKRIERKWSTSLCTKDSNIRSLSTWCNYYNWSLWICPELKLIELQMHSFGGVQFGNFRCEMNENSWWQAKIKFSHATWVTIEFDNGRSSESTFYHDENCVLTCAGRSWHVTRTCLIQWFDDLTNTSQSIQRPRGKFWKNIRVDFIISYEILPLIFNIHTSWVLLGWYL